MNQRTHEKTNLKKWTEGIVTYTIENTWIDRSFMDGGWGNGYIGIPESHYLYGIDYESDQVPGNVNGGWTYSSLEQIDGVDYWVFGFDTLHYGDTLIRWPQHKVADHIEEQVKYFSSLNI